MITAIPVSSWWGRRRVLSGVSHLVQAPLRAKNRVVVTLEQEFPYAYQDGDCHLWFFQHRLPGYAWYIPKNDGWLNVGIGGFVEPLKARHTTIRQYRQWFVQESGTAVARQRLFLQTRRIYLFYRDRRDVAQQGRALLIGEQPGSATRDLAEGIVWPSKRTSRSRCHHQRTAPVLEQHQEIQPVTGARC